VAGVPLPVIIFVVVAVLAWILLERTYIGRQIYAVAGNREAARLAGMPVRRRLMLTYVISGACAGLVAVHQPPRPPPPPDPQPALLRFPPPPGKRKRAIPRTISYSTPGPPYNTSRGSPRSVMTRDTHAAAWEVSRTR
jgi:hypothetical protein